MIKIKANNKKGYYLCVNGGIVDFSYPSSTERRGRVQGNGNISPALTAEYVLCRIEVID